MRISDWSSDVCSSDLRPLPQPKFQFHRLQRLHWSSTATPGNCWAGTCHAAARQRPHRRHWSKRSEEHTSELQSLMRISYAVFCLKKKKTNKYESSEHKQQQNITNVTTHKI